MNRSKFVLAAAAGVFAGASEAQLTLIPLTSFGGGDGWLAPGEDPNLTTDNTQRGMTYDAGSNTVIVVDRNGGLSVELYNGDTGASTGQLDVTGVAGGLFPLNTVDVADDGTIYAAALSLSGDAFVWRWANQAAAPTLAFQGSFTGLTRLGDSFAVTGSGTDTRIAVGGSGSDGVLVLDTADGSTFTASGLSPIANVPAGGMRLGLDFIAPGTLVGDQTGSDLYTVDTMSATGTVFTKNSIGEAPLAYYADGTGLELLATVDINSSDVRLYDASDLSLITSTGFLDLANLTPAGAVSPSDPLLDNPNGNGVGDLKFGVGPDGSLRLYAMNTNNGIQAFEVVPEPATAALLGLGGLAMLRRRSA